MKRAKPEKGWHCKHYKGTWYTILHIAIHTETQEEMVVYTEQDISGKVWTRPMKMFTETIEYKNKIVNRFDY